jgi:hypothetical protein
VPVVPKPTGLEMKTSRLKGAESKAAPPIYVSAGAAEVPQICPASILSALSSDRRDKRSSGEAIFRAEPHLTMEALPNGRHREYVGEEEWGQGAVNSIFAGVFPACCMRPMDAVALPFETSAPARLSRTVPAKLEPEIPGLSGKLRGRFG